jgi:hypothetical protein
MPNQSNDDPASNYQSRIPPDIELAGDVRRSIAKIFNNFMVKAAKKEPDNLTPITEKEQTKDE